MNDKTILRGTVSHYNTERGFGFIKPDAVAPDIFFHVSGLATVAEPKRGARVEFEEGQGDRSGKPEAKQVKVFPKDAP